MRWASGLLDGFVATMEARFAEADSMVAEAFELGMQTGDPDAFPFFFLQYSVLGMFAGRHDELFPVAQQAMESDPLLGARVPGRLRDPLLRGRPPGGGVEPAP